MAAVCSGLSLFTSALKCVCSVIEINDPNINRLIDYNNYYRLNAADINELWNYCGFYSPDKLEGKCIFENAVECGEKKNQFAALSAIQERVLVTSEVMLGDQVKYVRQIMFYRNEFLEVYFLEPIWKCY